MVFFVLCFLVTGVEVLSPERLFVGWFRFYFEWVWVIFGFSLCKREKSRVFCVSRVSFVGFLGIYQRCSSERVENGQECEMKMACLRDNRPGERMVREGERPRFFGSFWLQKWLGISFGFCTVVC